MAVELKELYREIQPKYDVQLHTDSCFQKMITWIHMVEYIDYIPRLHADELVFNSGLNNISDIWLENYIQKLNEAHAGGLIIALRKGRKLSQSIIDYCNEIHFPLFSATWDAPYNEIMRDFAFMLLRNEQTETNLIAAAKNAIFYPENTVVYLPDFERYGMYRDMNYTVLLLSCKDSADELGSLKERLHRIVKSARYALDKGIVYEEEGRMIALIAGHSQKKIRNDLETFCKKQPNVYVGIGTTVSHSDNIHRSYESAYVAYQMARSEGTAPLLCYDDLGVYKLLADVKEPKIRREFVREILGNLMDYDKKNGSDYLSILKAFFEYECSILETSKALFCHKNTLNYKMNKIKEILGYNIMTNRNRTRITIALYIIQMGPWYFSLEEDEDSR